MKLYDAWLNIGWEIYEGEPAPEEDEDTVVDEDFEAYEGWFWMAASHLTLFWFSEANAAVEELFQIDDSWDGQWRPLHIGAAMSLGRYCVLVNNHAFTLNWDVRLSRYGDSRYTKRANT